MKTVLLMAVLVSVTTALQSPAAVKHADFVVAGVGDQVDSAAVRRVLGNPDSVTTSEHPYQVGTKLVDWWYPRVRVSYNGTEKVAGIWLLARGPQTRRGLEVGDRQQQVRALYGAPASVDTASNAWVYLDTEEASEMHLIKVFFESGRVATVFLGWVLD